MSMLGFSWPKIYTSEIGNFLSDTGRRPNFSWMAFIPFWVPAAFSSICLAPLIVAAIRKRRMHDGGCLACHYDLTGNVSGTCPECGTAIAPRTNTEVAD